ncbi:MAG: magnesium chelatase, partial [Desulfatiglandales bacterium]
SIQQERFKGTNIYTNARMRTKELKKYCLLNDKCKEILRSAMERFNLSARAYTRIIKIGRTIADIEGSEDIQEKHLLEAIQYRSFDRGPFR